MSPVTDPSSERKRLAKASAMHEELLALHERRGDYIEAGKQLRADIVKATKRARGEGISMAEISKLLGLPHRQELYRLMALES